MMDMNEDKHDDIFFKGDALPKLEDIPPEDTDSDDIDSGDDGLEYDHIHVDGIPRLLGARYEVLGYGHPDDDQVEHLDSGSDSDVVQHHYNRKKLDSSSVIGRTIPQLLRNVIVLLLS